MDTYRYLTRGLPKTSNSGNLLGAQLASQAKIASRVVCISGLLMGVFNSSIMLLSRNKVGFVFSEDLAVIELLKEIIPLIAIFQIGDDLTGATQGNAALLSMLIVDMLWV